MNTDLISALQHSKHYPHPVTGIELIETHISWIILTGEYAYKIKKPVNFGFLDFTSLAQRKQYCEAELNLNRRAAPDLYEGLVAISGSPDRPILDSEDAPFEYAIRMKQFKAGQLFSELAHTGDLSAELTEELAHQVASFHARVDVASETDHYGLPAQVYAPMQQNFEQIADLLEDKDLLLQLRQMEAWTESSFQRFKPLLEARKKDGKVRECHGDLHLGNITRFQDKVTLFDCIEFNNDFRWIDVISDIAFLVMDFEIYGLPALANRFLNTYLEETGDYSGLRLMYFYKAYRAIVRAKIALLTRQDPSLSDEAREALFTQYKKYMELAEDYTSLPNRFVLTMHGISGTGKSTVALRLVDQLGAVRIRSDAERKRLFGQNIHQHPDASMSARMYSDQSNHETYEKLATLCADVLDAGLSVIVDATNLKQWQRDTIQQVADSQGVPLCIAYCQASMAVIRKWIQKRSHEDVDPSDANLEVANRQALSRDPLTVDEMKHTFVIHSNVVEETRDLADRIRESYLN